MNRKKFLNSEMIIALSAILISLCALTVSIYEMKVVQQTQADNQRAQKISVWPNLAFVPSRNSKGLRLSISNNGIGPGVIKFLSVHYDGNDIGDIGDLVRKLEDIYPDLTNYQCTYGNISKERVFAASTTHTLLDIPDGDLSKNTWRDMVSGKLDMSLCYCSVYDECWQTSLSANSVATPTNTCMQN